MTGALHSVRSFLRRFGPGLGRAGALAAVLCAAAARPVASRKGEQSPQGPWERLLQAVGLERGTCRFDLLDMQLYGGDAFRLAHFDTVHRDPLKAPFYARISRQGILAARERLGPLVSWAAGRTSDGTRLDLLGDPLQTEVTEAAAPDALLKAMQKVWESSGKVLSEEEMAGLREKVAVVAPEVQKAAALLLLASVRASEWRSRGLAAMPESERSAFFAAWTAPPNDDDAVSWWDMAARVDLKRLLVGGELLAFALDHARAILSTCKSKDRFRFDVETPLGMVSLRGADDDVYDAQTPYLLAIDTGGNDLYRCGGGTTSAHHGIGILVDVRGNDRYISLPELDERTISELPDRMQRARTPAFGAGVLGYGMLLDMEGNDTYRSPGVTQGTGIVGVGLLADLGGNDTYDCHTLGQGAGCFGAGVLSDSQGQDRYECFTTSQGYGQTKGCGLLADFGAQDDTYLAHPSPTDFPSPQSAQHNATLAQGFGYGRRADYTDGHSLAGGIGVLMDEAGSNTFRCGVFGQGAGYWYGLGMLLTGPGDDSYEGVWYVQGSAAHFAVGILHDAGGNDRYVATMNMAQGAGHDFSLGFLVDRAGNDRYEAPNLSLGGGNSNGIGVFWDCSGDDVYVVRPSTTLGRASIEPGLRGSIRERNLTLGLFLDTGGRDTYPQDIRGPATNVLWTMADTGSAPPIPSSRGAGLDTDAPDTQDPP